MEILIFGIVCWFGLCLALPLIGIAGYVTFGILGWIGKLLMVKLW